MDLQPNKTDAIIKPITNTRISASEWNQLVGSCMEFITQAGMTPDANDNEQFLNAFIQIAQNLGAIGANVDFTNVSSTGKSNSISWGMPDYSADVSLGEPTTYQTLPCDCYVYYGADTGSSIGSQGFYYANPDESYEGVFRQALTYNRSGLGMFLPKGWKVKRFDSNSTIHYVPLKGVLNA